MKHKNKTRKQKKEKKKFVKRHTRIYENDMRRKKENGKECV